MTVEQVNTLDRDAFVARFGGVFEHSPWVAEVVWAHRPWQDRAALHGAMCAAIQAAPLERRLELIRAHPDLVGRAALAGTLTRASAGEQAAAGLDLGRLSADEIARFTAANTAYHARFGFPFVICARENPKSAILAGFTRRLGNDRDVEIATALGEIEKIAYYRLVDSIDETE
ncbi:MAG: 2-oxo-4-hydroxy-4-carboxy-5-ureidoimidazoline decarboxylase [Thermomicrobiales bacterium]|nr:2-oxo-4-hydroxy-4-carboxy-5-ureidoimidazoline decarboxylase [Thermomicrobiales bacterium]